MFMSLKKENLFHSTINISKPCQLAKLDAKQIINMPQRGENFPDLLICSQTTLDPSISPFSFV